MAGMNTISGVRMAAQGFSRTIDPPIEQTALVNFQTSPETPSAMLWPRFRPSRNSSRVRAQATIV